MGAWVVQNGGGRGANVFFEASLSWQKRQSVLRAQEDRAKWAMWVEWGGAAGAAGPASDKPGAAPPRAGSSGMGRRANAADLAAAARKWRDFQRSKRMRGQRYLSDSLSSTTDE